MVRACLDVVLQPFPCLRNGFHGALLEVRNSCPQGIGFAHGEELGDECHGTFVLHFDSFLFLVEPLFCPPREGEGKQAEPDALKCDILGDDSVAQLKEVLEMHVCVLARQTSSLVCQVRTRTRISNTSSSSAT